MYPENKNSNNMELVQLLLSHGARTDSQMKNEEYHSPEDI